MTYAGCMVIKNSYTGCTRLYWELEDFDREAPEATFRFHGQIYQLEFDGCVDDLIWNNLKNQSQAAVDIAELYEAVPMIEAASPLLGSGEKLTLDLQSGHRWVATQRTNCSGSTTLLRSNWGQCATITRDSDNQFRRLVLRTEGRGISHEIKAVTGVHGHLEPIAEAVTIFH